MANASVQSSAVSPLPSLVPDIREKRSAPRVSAQLPTEIEVDGLAMSGKIADLSAGGASVVTAGADIQLGHVLRLAFALPRSEDQMIRCAGLVRSLRTREGKAVCGVEFHQLEARDRKSIASWVRGEVNPQAGDIARNHWRGEIHASEAFLVPQREQSRRALRWQPGMVSLYKQVAHHLLDQDRVFVPYVGKGLTEGDRLYLEVVPPASHVVLRVLAEVVWVQAEPNGNWGRGVGLRLAGLTPMDRATLQAQLRWFRQEAERYR